MSRRVVVAAHGHCFDGIASATLFSHLRNSLDPRPVSFRYLSCGYGPKMRTVPERWLRGDENAIVDFRYTDSAKLHWYFDHHPTAFANAHQKATALQGNGTTRIFFDDSYRSCAKLIADVGKDRFGIGFQQYEDLIQWAERIDSASFTSATEAIALDSPVRKLAAVVERYGDAKLYNTIVPLLMTKQLEEVAEHERVRELFEQIAEQRLRVRERIEAALQMNGNTAIADLSEAPLPGSGKFIAYALQPNCTYSASLMRMKNHFKISIGYNPWSESERRHDIASICEKWGGGGHAVVGAISFQLHEHQKARATLRSVASILNGEQSLEA